MESLRWSYGKLLNFASYFLAGGNKEKEENDIKIDNNSSATVCIRRQEKAFSGAITAVLEAEVIVNGSITVDRQLFQQEPKCGMVLRGTAIRASSLDQWTATAVDSVEGDEEEEPQEMWEEVVPERTQACLNPKEKHLPSKMIAMVTEFSRSQGMLNNEIDFSASSCEPGFWVCAGDWVLVNLSTSEDDNSESGQQHVVRISPHRKSGFRGQVTVSQRGFGIVNKQISFFNQACQGDYRPRVGDIVEGVCIESVQLRDCSYRALTVRRSDASMADQSEFGTFPLLNHLRALEEDSNNVEDDRPRIQVEPNSLNFGKVLLDNSVSLSMQITNPTSEPIRMKTVELSTLQNSQFSLLTIPNEIPPNSSKAVVIRFSAKHLGLDQQTITIEYDGFRIQRHILRGTGMDPVEQSMTNSERRAIGRGRGGWRSNAQNPRPRREFVMPGVKPTFGQPAPPTYLRLKAYMIPQTLRRIFDRDVRTGSTINPSALMEVKALLEQSYPSLCRAEATMDDFVARWSTLLYLEEYEEETELSMYNIQDAKFERKGEFLTVEIPGLREGRPSIIVGDRVVVSQVRENHRPANSDGYEGFVHDIKSDEAFFMFHRSFHSNFTPSNQYYLEFTVNRIPYRRMHQALEVAVKHLGQEILYPSLQLQYTKLAASLCPKESFPTHTDSDFFNKKLNEEQKAAVMRALHARARPRPYIIFGPPGTGKTTTLVELILQIYARMPFSRLLVVAPSNFAADLLCEKLTCGGLVGDGDIVRLIAAYRDRTLVDESIRHLCVTRDSIGTAVMHRIVVSTCVSSGVIQLLRLPAGHFTHIVVDEAGQAMEPECLIPVCIAAQSHGQIVLAGDPFQLGPVVSSRWALRYGLQRSLLERILQLPSYARGESGFDPLLVTKLVKNYRSHPAIIEPYSQLFYDGELQSCAPNEVISRLLQWDYLPNKGFPVAFIGVRGIQCRDPDSPSWFNPSEAVEAVRAAGRLLCAGLTSEQIGIITPYRKQVEKIRDLLANSSGADTIKVGSVEELQGQERMGVIVSTVRSEDQSLTLDIGHSLGFLTNPKRFNVAISRAQAALVVVGNPYVLCHDPQWLHFLRYICANDGYRGCDLSDLPQLNQS